MKKLITLLVISVVVGLLVSAVFIGYMLFRTHNQKTELASNVVTPEVSANTLKEHTNKDDCWVILGGVVYNATSVFNTLPEHSELLYSYCGSDVGELLTIQKYSQQTLPDSAVKTIKEALITNKVGIVAP